MLKKHKDLMETFLNPATGKGLKCMRNLTNEVKPLFLLFHVSFLSLTVPGFSREKTCKFAFDL